MKVSAPHFLLYSQARGQNQPSGCGQWRFVLESADGAARLEAADQEPATGERLELLAIVRGLEALDQPSRVTLVTGSRYVNRGIRFGLTQWREDGWQWERYGELSPIKDDDLWRRVDQALLFHQVECRGPRLDASDDLDAPALRVVPAPSKGEGGDAAEPPAVIQTRRHRGKAIRFDAGESPRPARRAGPAATWWSRLWTWLQQSFGRMVTVRGPETVVADKMVRRKKF